MWLQELRLTLAVLLYIVSCDWGVATQKKMGKKTEREGDHFFESVFCGKDGKTHGKRNKGRSRAEDKEKKY
jgi:hypothetical protein